MSSMMTQEASRLSKEQRLSSTRGNGERNKELVPVQFIIDTKVNESIHDDSSSVQHTCVGVMAKSVVMKLFFVFSKFLCFRIFSS